MKLKMNYTYIHLEIPYEIRVEIYIHLLFAYDIKDEIHIHMVIPYEIKDEVTTPRTLESLLRYPKCEGDSKDSNQRVDIPLALI